MLIVMKGKSLLPIGVVLHFSLLEQIMKQEASKSIKCYSNAQNLRSLFTFRVVIARDWWKKVENWSCLKLKYEWHKVVENVLCFLFSWLTNWLCYLEFYLWAWNFFRESVRSFNLTSYLSKNCLYHSMVTITSKFIIYTYFNKLGTISPLYICKV